MKNIENNKGFILILTLVLVAAFSRLIPHAPNFTAVGAMALFGAAHFTKKYLAFVVPIAAMWFSDLFINNFVYASESFVWFQSFQLYTIIPMVLIVLAGLFLFKNKVTPSNVLGGSVLATIIFFLVSNFGTWISPYSLFPNTFGGLVSTYVAGLPFALNTLAGDMFFSLALFGSFFLFTTKFPSFKLAKVKSK